MESNRTQIMILTQKATRIIPNINKRRILQIIVTVLPAINQRTRRGRRKKKKVMLDGKLQLNPMLQIIPLMK